MNHVPMPTAARVAPITQQTLAKNVADCVQSVDDLKAKCLEVQETSDRLGLAIPGLELHQLADDVARVRGEAEKDVGDLRSDSNKVGTAVDATIASLDEGFKDPSIAADKKGLSADTLEWGPKTIQKIAGRMSESSRSLTFRVALELSQAPDFMQTLSSKTIGVLESDARVVAAAKKEARDNKRELKAQKEEVARLVRELETVRANHNGFVEGLSAAGKETESRLQDELAKVVEENKSLAERLKGQVGVTDQPMDRTEWMVVGQLAMEAIEVLGKAGNEIAIKEGNHVAHWQISPSSLTVLAPCANIGTACFATLVADRTNACILTQHVNRLSHMLSQCDEANVLLVDLVLRTVVGNLDQAVNQDLVLDDVGLLLVGLHQATRMAMCFGKSGDLKNEVEERLKSHPCFHGLAQGMATMSDLHNHCLAAGRVWDAPNVGLIGYKRIGLMLVDFDHSILYHISRDKVVFLSVPQPGPLGRDKMYLKLLTPGGVNRDSVTLPLTMTQWFWWSNACEMDPAFN